MQQKYTNSCPRSLRTPLNSYKCRLGGSHSTVPLKSNRSLVSSNPAVAVTACRIFKLVSPSKLDVSMNAIACGSLDDTITMSAGKNALFTIRTISPTRRFCHLMATHWPLRSVSTSRWLMSSSARCRFYIFAIQTKKPKVTFPKIHKLSANKLCILNKISLIQSTYEIFDNLFDGAYS